MRLFLVLSLLAPLACEALVLKSGAHERFPITLPDFSSVKAWFGGGVTSKAVQLHGYKGDVEDAKEGGNSNHKAEKKEKMEHPHIMFILLDDLGWSDASFNREAASHHASTPNMDSLASTGVILQRHYVHKTCSPTRSAIQSGRAPIHVNVLNLASNKRNAEDPVGGYAGIPMKMTGMAEVLRGAGYRTHMVGKWDAGMATPRHTPAGRGYDTSLVYFNHDNDCWTAVATESQCSDGGIEYDFKDLWEHDIDDKTMKHPGRPARAFLNAAECNYTNQVEGCKYEDEVFENRVTDIIENHAENYKDTPMFLFWATRAVHGDYQPPHTAMQNYRSMLVAQTSDAGLYTKYYENRTNYFSMISWTDESIGRVVSTLKRTEMYENTVIVLSSDNGAQPGGNNYPLRGSKWSSWEGGIRAASFVSGGFLPFKVRGTSSKGLVAAWDWYATFAHLAGANPTDKMAEAAGLPAIDSVNVWDFITSKDLHNKDMPRKVLVIGGVVGGEDTDGKGQTQVSGLIKWDDAKRKYYKLILGESNGNTIRCSAWGNPLTLSDDFPEQIYPIAGFCNTTQVCGHDPETGCLFDLDEDPGETKSLAKHHKALFKKMLANIVKANQTVYSPNRGKVDPTACTVGKDRGSFWGPWLF